MGFIAPFIPQLIGLGGSLIGGLLGKKKSGAGGGTGAGATPLLPPGLDQAGIQAGVNKQTGVGDWLFGTGKDTFGKGSNLLNDPISFYSNILSGNRQSIMENLAPEISAINAQFNAPLQEAALTGRGTSLMPDLEAKKQASISNLIFSERPQAADKLTGISQGLMNLGTTQAAGAADTYRGATGDLIDYNKVIRGLQFEGSRDSAAQYGALGTSIGNLLSQILLKRQGAGSPAPPPVPPIDLKLPPLGGFT